jgi:SAM-dependent methyltransferase
METDLFSMEPATDPLAIYRLRDGLYGVDLLAAAVSHFDFFTWLAEHPSTPGGIAAHFGFKIRPLDVLLTLSSALGLTTQAGGVVHVTLRAREHLVTGSPWCLKPYYDALRDRPQTRDFAGVLTTGRPANWASSDPQAWAKAMEDPVFAERFTAAMDCRGMLLGPALARVSGLTGTERLLDLAGGSGVYACALAAFYPGLRCAVLEREPVDRIASAAIAKRGYAERVPVITGDLFSEQLPEGYDAYLISNVLHDWDEADVREILFKVGRAMTTGGRLLLHDAHLNDAKTGPLPVAQYSALLAHSTEGRCYSTLEMRTWMDEAGFDWIGHHPTAVDRSVIIGERR